MSILETAMGMLEKHPLCNHCLGRQFAMLGRGIDNGDRGKALKLSLTMQASALTLAKNPKGSRQLRVLASNGFSRNAEETLRQYGKRAPGAKPEACFLCDGKFQFINELVEKAFTALAYYEYTSFLVGVELPVSVEEREDEFKAAFNVGYSESIRHEFGRLLGKRIEALSAKTVEYRKPDVTLIINPFAEEVKIQVNPLFVAGRYRKLVRDIPQSKWFCSSCRG